MPLARAQPPDPKQRLLAFAADLLAEVEALDLDTIDGEFYWRWCRADLLDPHTVVPKLPRPIGLPDPTAAARRFQAAPALEGTFEPEGLVDYLRESLRFVADVLELSDHLAQRFPRIVWQRLLEGERVSMRAAEVEFLLQDLGGGTQRAVCLRVYSGAWTGAQVEDELRRLTSSRYANLEAIPPQHESIGLQLRFDFVSEAQARAMALDEEPIRAPYVQAVAPLPLPPKKTIAREYDALVREERGWHLNLPGSGSRQEMVVAIRTWAIGLLAHDGVPVNHAISLVHEHLGLPAITQTCFGGDRKRLLERVPEAEPHLYVPIGRDQRDTRSVRPHPLVSATLPTAHAQPDQPDETLYP